MPLGPATRSIKTPFCFLDETGTLPAPRDRFFGVGMLKCEEACDLQQALGRIRARHNFYGEWKWSAIKSGDGRLERLALSEFFSVPDATFGAFLADKSTHDPIGRFGNHWKAYEALARQLVLGNLGRNEVLTVLADEYVTPPTVDSFEKGIRDWVNEKVDRLAVSGVSRMRSTGHDCLQLADLLLGATAYEAKIRAGLIPSPNPAKLGVLQHVRQLAGGSLVHGFRTAKINIAAYRE